MDLYTLTPNFLARDYIDEFVSAIWTERYSSAGEVQLVVPATQENIDKLADGTFLALRGSQEVMIIETQSIENGIATIVGKDLLSFLNQRWVWYLSANASSDQPEQLIGDYTVDSGIPGQVIADVVSKMVIAPLDLSPSILGANLNLNWDAEKIAYLTLGAVDTTGPAKRITIPIGPLYDGIAKVASDESLGISLYLASADRVAGYSLKFTTYRGQDHTTDGNAPLVRLTPDADSIQDLKEIRSIQEFKNIVYVLYKGILSRHLLDPANPEPEGFDRRILVQDASAQGTYDQTPPTNVTDFRNQTAKDAFANHNYIQALDGQSSPISEYVYGVHYGLGDIIELQGLTGTINKARITEYIRSQDKSGENSYPTISVVT